MTTTECIEIIASADSGGVFTDEMRGDPKFLIGVLNTGRGLEIRNRYMKSQDIHPNFKQLVFPKFIERIQEYDADCYTVFKLERAIDINDVMDGYLSCSSGVKEGSESLTRLKSRAEHDNLLKHRVGRVMLQKKNHWFPDPSSGLMLVFHRPKEPVKKIKYEIIAEDPTSVEGFNIDKDDYPITMDALKRVEEMVRQGTIYGYLKVKANKVSNSQDDGQLQAEQ